MARALGVASGGGLGWAMGVVRSAGLSCHPCLPLSWVKPCPQGLSPPSWPPGHISCQQEAAFPAPGPSHGPRPLPGHASRSLPDTCCPRSRSARRLPKDGRYVQFSPSLIPGDTRHASQVCAPLCGWRFKPACPSRRGVPRARSASFSPPVSSLLGTGPAAVRGDGRTPAPAPGAGIARKSFSLKPCALICGRKAKNSTAFVALFRD